MGSPHFPSHPPDVIRLLLMNAVPTLLSLCFMPLLGMAASPVPKAPNASQPGAVNGAPDSGAIKPVDEIRVFKRNAVEQAANFVRQNDRSGADGVIESVEKKLGADDPFVDELRGTVLTLEKDYTSAEGCFRKMLTKVPDSHIGRFNLAETVFLEARYEEAAHYFSTLESSRREMDPALADLCRYKRVVCLLALGLNEQANALLPAPSDGPSSPAVQYARAALSFARKDRSAAVAAIERARKDFSPEVENLYTDSLIELRWGERNPAGEFTFVSAEK
jgi:tetratricopeptide (TPR) repeat protein